LTAAAIGLAWLFAFTNSAKADEVVMSAHKSNTLIQVTSGTAQQLSNAQGDIFVGRTLQDGTGPAATSIRRGLVEFNPSATVPAGATITGVTLTAEELSGFAWTETVSLNRMLRDWGQGTSLAMGGSGAPATTGDVTWYYPFYGSPGMWAAPGGKPGVDFSASASAATLISGSAEMTFAWSSSANPALVSDVQHWLDSPRSNFGWIMLGGESTAPTAKVFGGQYATSGASPPQLFVQYLAPWTWSGGGVNNAWTTSGNWTNTGIPPSGAAIVLGDSHSTIGTVNLLSATQTISHLTFDANEIMTITGSASGGGRLTFDNGVNPVAIVISGSGHAIENRVAVMLDSDAWITTGSSGDLLTIAGNIADGTGVHRLVKQGAGTLVLSGSDTFRGGATVSDGTLIATSVAALASGTNLTVGGGAWMFDSSSASAIIESTPGGATAVPEPRTWAILAAELLAVTFAARVRSGG
jgi:autotransporter-associated beta strand protein